MVVMQHQNQRRGRGSRSWTEEQRKEQSRRMQRMHRQRQKSEKKAKDFQLTMGGLRKLLAAIEAPDECTVDVQTDVVEYPSFEVEQHWDTEAERTVIDHVTVRLP